MQAPPPSPPPGRPQEEEGGDVIEQLSRVPANMRCGGCGSKAREYDEPHLWIVYIMELWSVHPAIGGRAFPLLPQLLHPPKKPTFSYQ